MIEFILIREFSVSAKFSKNYQYQYSPRGAKCLLLDNHFLRPSVVFLY